MEELQIDSVVRGHHIYKSIWTPVIGKERYLEPKESNEHDKYAVAVKKDGEIVGHVPCSFPHISWYPAFIRSPSFTSYLNALSLAFNGDQAFI